MDSIPADPQEVALRFGGQPHPTVCKYLPPAEPTAHRWRCPVRAAAFRAGLRPENIHPARFQATSGLLVANTVTNSSPPLTLESRTLNIQSNRSQKSFPKGALLVAQTESALLIRAIFPPRQWSSSLRSGTRHSQDDCDPPKTNEAQSHVV